MTLPLTGDEVTRRRERRLCVSCGQSAAPYRPFICSFCRRDHEAERKRKKQADGR